MIVGRYVGSASKGNQEFASSAQKHRCRTCSEGKKGIERAFPDKARDRQGKSSGKTIPHRKQATQAGVQKDSRICQRYGMEQGRSSKGQNVRKIGLELKDR